jgi:Ca2+-binding RTX toxin-like protein
MPVFRDRTSRSEFSTLAGDDSTQIQFMRAVGKVATSSATVLPAPQALIDTVPGNTSTTATLTVDAAPIISAVDTIADEDFYSIQLIAGHQYQIGMYAYTPQGPGDPAGPNGVPLSDSYLELYDSAGTLITSADGGSDTTFNTANSGFDALLTFTASTTGTYYVNARAFDNTPLDGSDNGDVVGDYGLYAEDVTGDESLYTPYYSPDSPLYAIDWGTQVDKVNHTARNPDGNEGPRATGNAQGTPTFGNPVDIAALAAAQHVDITGKNVITIYYAKAGDIFVSNDPSNPGLPPATITAVAPKDFELLAVRTALAEFSKVADVVYIEVQDRAQADFIYTSYAGTPGPGVSLLGSMSPPGESDEGLAQFNNADERWNARDLAQGGFSFVTLIHEFGHGHGLAHPHDNGGHSGIMNGVEPEGAGVADYTTGNFDLNQGVFTMMSYEDGWQTSPNNPHNASTTAGYGYLGGLMAFDIAAIQDKYGVNEDTATGDNTYTIIDVNAAGTYYTSIWDVSGNDTIAYGGTRNATIDLRAASLQYEYGGGGWVSHALGIYGGFTIANSVVIENAQGGGGNDTLIGNQVDNTLLGGAGNDALTGNAGNDYLDGGTGADAMSGGTGDDIYLIDNTSDTAIEAAGEGVDRAYATASFTLSAGSQVELLSARDLAGTGALDLGGNELANEIWGNAGVNFLNGGAGNDVLIGFAGNDTLLGGAGIDYLDGGADADGLVGSEGNDTLIGAAGNDYLEGGTGVDAMYGGTGDDAYLIDDAGDVASESTAAGIDRAFSSVTYVLAAGSEIEILSASDNAGTAAIDLYGNEIANELWGNEGVNFLSGGAGNDSMLGFGGNDTLLGGAGNDYLDGGTGNDALVGSDGNDTMVGRAGNDYFDGGTGADGMYGGAGDDAYLIDDAGDFAVEAAGEGQDIAYTTINYALAAGSAIEILSARDNAGTGALNLTGNELANELWGNNGANSLSGGAGNDALVGFGGADTLTGGAGDDYLAGGTGADTFAFTAALGLGNIDAIADFSAVDDTIALDHNVFAGLGLGPLGAGAFVIGSAAGDADDRIIYNSATGALLFDADGNGAGAAVQFATLAGAPAITASDFLVI